MSSNALQLAGHLGENRVKTSLKVWPGMFHVRHLFVGAILQVDQALRNATAFLEEPLPDRFLDASALPTLHDRCGLSTDEVVAKIKTEFGDNTDAPTEPRDAGEEDPPGPGTRCSEPNDPGSRDGDLLTKMSTNPVQSSGVSVSWRPITIHGGPRRNPLGDHGSVGPGSNPGPAASRHYGPWRSRFTVCPYGMGGVVLCYGESCLKMPLIARSSRAASINPFASASLSCGESGNSFRSSSKSR